MDYTQLETKINYFFKNKELLKTALTHSSASTIKNSKNNQRLEFLGDAVLQLCISELLYEKLTKSQEGILSKKRALIVCTDSLYEASKTIDLEAYLILGKGEEVSGGRNKKNIAADAMESLMAAIYLDGGMQPAKDIIYNILCDIINAAIEGELTYDYKTVLQEYVQTHSLGELKYILLNKQGPEHDMIFTYAASINGVLYEPSQGKNHKEAEQKAAKAALESIQ